MKKPSHRLYPYKDRGRFYNYPGEKVKGFIFNTLQTYIRSVINGNHKPIKNISDWKCDYQALQGSGEPAITWLGHSTFLIQVGGVNILVQYQICRIMI